MKKDQQTPAAGGKRGRNARMTRAELKQRIRALKKERANAGDRHAKSKVEEFNSQLRMFRRRLRYAARHKAA